MKKMWKKIAKGEMLPTSSIIRPIDGGLPNIAGSRVMVGQDCYYLSVDDACEMLKDLPLETEAEAKERNEATIIKKLIGLVKETEFLSEENRTSLLDWLEKKGEQKQELLTKEKALKNSPFVEQKPADKVEPKFKVGDYVKNVNDKREPIYEIVYMDKECYICKSDDASLGDKAVMHFTFDNPYLRLVEQKPVRQQCADFYNKNGELQMPRLTAFENELANILFDREYDGSTETEDDIQRGKLDYELAAIRLAPKLQSLINIEQKPAWSEEDKAMINNLYQVIDDHIVISGDTRRMFCSWLKDLKDRVQLQPVQEWSKEDEELRALAIENLSELKQRYGEDYGKVGKCIDLLENIKNRILPIQPQREWSEESKKMLDAIYSCVDSHYDGLAKTSLLIWLKSLRPQNH